MVTVSYTHLSGMWKDLGTWNTLTEAMDSRNVGQALFSETCQNVHVVNELNLPDVYKRQELVSVKNYMDEHYVEKITLDDLEAQFFINKYYLLKIFKETYGVTISSYLISRRITRAKQLLRFTQMTIDEVGCAVGMDGAGYFSRMFKKSEGISPKKYRKQWQ